jgi:hypothetical protein
METNMSSHDLNKMLSALRGKACWYVNAGGAAGTSFSLSLGDKKPRKYPLKNPDVTDEFRRYEGEATLLVWCSWRLNSADDAEASSDESAEVVAQKLRRLEGQNIREIEMSEPAHDLRITFDSLSLQVFCDHIPGNPSFDGNWQLECRGRLVIVGPGFRVREEV